MSLSTFSGDFIDTALSQKEINRIKLAEARKRDAEKYGEVYKANSMWWILTWGRGSP